MQKVLMIPYTPHSTLPFQHPAAAAKKKDHVTFNRKCGVLNRRDDERKYRSVYIVARVRERRKKTIKNIQMRSVCAVRRKEMSII